MVHQQPTCQSVSPEVKVNAIRSPIDDSLGLRIAAMSLGDSSDEMLRRSVGLRSFVKKGQDGLIYLTAQSLYDCGLARSKRGNEAVRERQAFDKGMRSKMPTDNGQHFKIGDADIGQDTNGDSDQEHEFETSVANNATLRGLLKLSDEFAQGLDLLEKGTLLADPQSLQLWNFNFDLAKRNHTRETQPNTTKIGDLWEELKMVNSHHDPALEAAHMRREIEVSNFYESFDYWYRSASTASDDNKPSVRLQRKTKLPGPKETVEEPPNHILHLAKAIQGECAGLVSYLNWINQDKVWGLLDEGRCKAHYLLKRLLKSVEDGPVPQSILEALDAPATCATSPSSGEPHTVAIDRALEHNVSSTLEKFRTFEDKLCQVCRLPDDSLLAD